MSIEIQLTRGLVALIDEADLDAVSQHSWHARNCKGRLYAATSDRREGYPSTLYMHRLILPGANRVDHINGNSLDNRRANLRDVTHRQNIANTFARDGGTSRFKGVHWARHAKKWSAHITVNGKGRNLGYFVDETDAAKAYDAAARAGHGTTARLNFPLAGEASALEPHALPYLTAPYDQERDITDRDFREVMDDARRITREASGGVA